jgi:AraC-like DNA-binding protein
LKQQPLVEKIGFYQSEELPGVEILRADNTHHKFRWFHQTYSISIPLDFTVSSCSYQFTYRGKSHTGQIGQTMMLEPGEIHNTTKMAGPASFRVAIISPDVMEKFAKEMGMSGGRPHLKKTMADEPELFYAFKGLHKSLETTCTALERQSRFIYCCFRLLDVAAEKTPAYFNKEKEASAVRRAVDYLKANWAENISLTDLAKASRLSRFHLLRVFAREMGVPPHSYQLQLRIAKIRDFLRLGVSGTEAAAHAGFADQSHMNRHFKKIVGVTPTEYSGMVG